MACEQYLNLELSAIVEGDTWSGLTVSLKTTGTLLDSPLASVEMAFKHDDGTILTLSTEGEAPTITINNAADYDFTVEPIKEFPLPSGFASFFITTTDAEGTIRTIAGGTKEIKAKP